MGYCNFEVQTGCEKIVKVMQEPSTRSCCQTDDMESIRKNILEDGGGRFVHIYREQNFVADKLAKLALISTADWMEFDNPPPECRSLVCNDQVGVCRQRWVVSRI
nr:ribonuclease H [Ipomoea batatas]